MGDFVRKLAMSEYQQQKKAKPPIEETIDRYLTGEKKVRALAFVTFLRENKMSPQWGSTDSYNVSHKNRRVCILKFGENGFQIWANTQYNEDFNAGFEEESEENKAFLRSTIVHCFGCGSCKPGLGMEILGQQVTDACYNPVIRLADPDGERLELAKKLVLLRRQAIRQGKAPKVTYIAAGKRT